MNNEQHICVHVCWEGVAFHAVSGRLGTPVLRASAVAAERQGLGLTPQWPTEIYIHLGLGTVSLELLYGQLDSR